MTSSTRELAGAAAIVGLGFSDVGKLFGRSSGDLAIDAVRRALADCDMNARDVDGFIYSYGVAPDRTHFPSALGLDSLRLYTQMNSAGATAGAAIELASLAVASGVVRTVVYVHADAPLADASTRAGDAYQAASTVGNGLRQVNASIGLAGANPMYALAARRHMTEYGTTSEQLGAVAVSQRAWAASNPMARFRTPLTLTDHQRSRVIADPLRLFDCCVVTNGAIAFVVTAAERASGLPKAPVYVWGWGQGHPVYSSHRGSDFGLKTGAVASGRMAFDMAQIGRSAVTQAQLYDCYTYTVVVTLEDYGFCPKGEGGPFVASGATAPGGSLPTNTGGGQLSAYYLWGATPLSEAVVQVRGEGGDRQAPNDIVLVSGNGGVLDHHSTLILSPHRRP